MRQDDLLAMRALVQRYGWREFIGHVGSVMAEQADNCPPGSAQDKALFLLSTTLHSEFFLEKCGEAGFYDYRSHSMVPPEWLAVLNNYPPENTK